MTDTFAYYTNSTYYVCFFITMLQILKRLNKEKAALQTTAELLTVRLNSMNEILALQEEKMVKTVNVFD